jgi:hypothetical protein
MFDAPVDASRARERRPCTSDEQMVRELVTRLSRQDRRGASVIERAAILAEGANTELIVTWILDHGGQPEAPASASGRGGLHGGRLQGRGANDTDAPRRYVIPPGVLR